MFSNDLIIEILFRLPAKPLLRFKSVSKAWYSMISDPYFAKLHLQRSIATGNNLQFVIRTPSLSLADFDTFQNPVELNYPYKSYVSRGAEIVGSCRGLLCIWNMDIELSLYLYNPTTQTHKSLPYLPVNHPFTKTGESLPFLPVCHPSYYRGMDFCFGFGFDSLTGSYKCVRILMIPNKEPDSIKSEVMIYSSKTDCWTKGPDAPYYFYSPGMFSALLNETIHWSAYTESGDTVIVAFSLRNETFSSIPLPPTMSTGCQNNVFIGVLDECLCISVNYFDQYEVWVMKEYGVAESWVRQFTVRNDRSWNDLSLERPICFSLSRKDLFFRLVRGLVVSISMETLESEMVDVTGVRTCWDAHACVQNLLMLPERTQEI